MNNTAKNTNKKYISPKIALKSWTWDDLKNLNRVEDDCAAVRSLPLALHAKYSGAHIRNNVSRTPTEIMITPRIK
jgi:hypothetical protein